MNLATFPDARTAPLHPPADRFILITGGPPESKLDEDLCKEFREGGWVCEVFYGDASDRVWVRRLVRDALDCFHRAGVRARIDEMGSGRVVRAITDEEWLAQ